MTNTIKSATKLQAQKHNQGQQPLVRLSGNRLITTSLAVSNHFSKKHKHVLEAIERLECSREFREPNFRPTSYITSQGKKLPMYEITRDGFMFLCMGFTGAAAARWKEKYIIAFNTLEQSLHQNTVNIEQMQEIAKLTERHKITISKHVREMERFGILQPPKNLAKMQQLALNFQPSKGV